MMKIFRNILIALPICFFASCNECSVVEDQGMPEQRVRLLSADGDDLWFGDSVHYDPAEVVFEHESEGVLASEPDPGSSAVRLTFPPTASYEQSITMHVDSVTSYHISYNTVVYDRKCTRVYELSFVKFEGEQVCSDCAEEIIRFRL